MRVTIIASRNWARYLGGTPTAVYITPVAAYPMPLQGRKKKRNRIRFDLKMIIALL